MPQSAKGTEQELPKLQVASPGKRLFALIFDFIIALLISNTLQQIFREEHWDLVRREQTWIELLPFYAGLFGMLVLRDAVRGVSPGKLLLGLSARSRDAILTPLDTGRGLLRGVPFAVFP
ncbi:MAG TPA: hypothetical protein EYM25_01605, partial [Deltaproteobacteria bacterium]|nr:hypothetical protein [Deltaproteobacteria bacterium]